MGNWDVGLGYCGVIKKKVGEADTERPPKKIIGTAV